MFELDAVAYRLPQRTLLHPVNLTVEHGQMVGLIGHNGSGKSTLLRLMARQLTPSDGTLQLDRRPLDKWADRAFARQVAYLPQQLPGAEGLTVRQLVSFGRYPWHGPLGRYTATDREYVSRALALADVEAMADRTVDHLSGGERQRVWLAMLLAQNTRYLLLDEPIAALDVAHQVEVLSLIRRLAGELGLGVIVVLHEINMAARYCDHLVALHGGRLLVQGSPAELMRSETLESIYGLPMAVLQHPSEDVAIAVAQ